MLDTSTQLASTGSDSLVLFFVIGGLLLAAGVALMAFRALKRKRVQPDSALPSTPDTPEAVEDERPQR